MLCKECRTLLRAFKARPSPATSSQTALQPSARRSLSTAPRSESPQARAQPLQTRQRYASKVTSPLQTIHTINQYTPSFSTSFHTSATRQRPEATAGQEPPASNASSTTAGPEKPDFLNDAESEIWDRLVHEFHPAELVVQDISGGCGSMYGIEISSAKFQGATMLKQQRMVNAVLGDLMKGWHGCQLKTKVA
ncbi:bola protein [Coniella lustricola]|uniref:Bola protein n=1 Tax=Coniella lustricola TaxID=2025994 RepID=A0A2T3AJW3_9PEZI|nr:bola protein [Coniella lustricola]